MNTFFIFCKISFQFSQCRRHA